MLPRIISLTFFPEEGASRFFADHVGDGTFVEDMFLV